MDGNRGPDIMTHVMQCHSGSQGYPDLKSDHDEPATVLIGWMPIDAISLDLLAPSH
jgi:hypothetical protein